MMKVYEAIAAVSGEMAKEGISKDRKNQQQGYAFRGIDDVYNALAPIISKHRLCILPRVVGRECVERVNKNGNALFYVTVEAEFDFVSAEDGSKHTVKTFGEAMDSADKATNKAMSAAYKYAAMQAFCIPTEGDNDADASTHEVAPRRQETPARNEGQRQSSPAKNEDARATYAALQKQMRSINRADELKDWWTDADCKAMRSKLPVDWAKELEAECGAQGRALKLADGDVKQIQEAFPGAGVTNHWITDTSGRALENIEAA